MTTSWTDPNLVGGSPIRTVHVNELREAINCNRAAALLSDYTWSDGPKVISTTPIRATHMREMRQAIADLYPRKGLTLPAWTKRSGADPAGATPIYAADITDLRSWLNSYENTAEPVVGRGLRADIWRVEGGVGVTANNDILDDIVNLFYPNMVKVIINVMSHEHMAELVEVINRLRARAAGLSFEATALLGPELGGGYNANQTLGDYTGCTPPVPPSDYKNCFIHTFQQRAYTVALALTPDPPTGAGVRRYVMGNEPNNPGSGMQMSPQNYFWLAYHIWTFSLNIPGYSTLGYFAPLHHDPEIDPDSVNKLNDYWRGAYDEYIWARDNVGIAPVVPWDGICINVFHGRDSLAAFKKNPFGEDLLQNNSIPCNEYGHCVPWIICEWGVWRDYPVGEPTSEQRMSSGFRNYRPYVNELFYFSHHQVQDGANWFGLVDYVRSGNTYTLGNRYRIWRHADCFM